MMYNRIQSLSSTLWRDIRPIETTPQSIDAHIEKAVEWLYNSQDATGTGGSAACYNLILGWEPPYPETTGYIVPTLYNIADCSKRTEPANRAEQMAEWLLTVQMPTGAFPAGTYCNESSDPSVFNTGQILRGLTRSYQETEDERYRESAQSAIKWLGDVQQEDGSWWKHDYNSLSHSYSSRISWPVLEAVNVLDFEFGTEIAVKNLQWVVNQQTANGWFSKCSFERGKNPFLHTIAYTIRGLLEASIYLEGGFARECEQAAITAAEKLREIQQQNGILLGEFDANWAASGNYYCLTGNAQMAIIWGRLQELTSDNSYNTVKEETIDFLQRQQSFTGPPPICGGVRGSAPIWGKYMYLRYPNWACKFLIDALMQYRANNYD